MKVSYKLAAVAALPLVLAACGGDEQNYTSKVNYQDAETTLSGKIRNGVTNEAISDKSLKVKLFQGDDVRTAKLVKNEAGYYSISGIPTNTSANSNEYRVEVTADGYLPFVGTVYLDFNEQDYEQFVQDKKLFKVGNVNLYPVGYKTPDYQVTVKYNNQRIAGAEVEAELTATNLVANNTASLLSASAFTPEQASRIVATTNADGVATFAGASLVLNANYKLSVLPMNVGGVDLVNLAGITFSAGAAQPTQALTLNKLTQGTVEGLYVVSATNEYGDALPAGDGKLVITLSKEVELVGPASNVSAVLTNNTTAQLDGAQNANVTVTGNTITLTPKYSVNPAANDKNMFITYSNLTVNIKGINKTASVIGLTTSSGIALTGKVQITLP